MTKKSRRGTSKKSEKTSFAAGIASSIMGVLGSILGMLGLCGFCIIPTAFAGIAFVSMIIAVLTEYTIPLLVLGFTLLLTSFFLRKRHNGKCSACKAKVNSRKNK